VGDASLTRRPMERIRKPLEAMGARLTLTEGHAPLTIEGQALKAIDYTTPVPSAQVKTCILLAGLQTAGTTTVREAVRTRDHSELALRAFGATLARTTDSVSISGPQKLHSIEAAVPGDISSAAFFLCAAALFPGSSLVLDSLGLNPTRAALLDVLTALGARINVLNLEEKNAELSVAEKDDIARAVGLGALRYNDLKENRMTDIAFDWDKMLDFTGDSGPYLQYAYARLRSIIRKSGIAEAKIMKADAAFLDSEVELALARTIFQFPEIVEKAAELYATSTLATYLYKLAAAANKFYETTPILSGDAGSRNARLMLVAAAARTLRSGLALLGVETPEKI